VPQDPPPLVVTRQQMLDEERSALSLTGRQGDALCLSGGGIRSAAFCLGVLQSLAARDLLHRFDYLSTVSGGGYIGAFLHAALAPANQPNPAPDLKTVLDELLASPVQSNPANPTPHFSPEVGKLRDNTSFLAPQPGLASLDAWAGILLWVRNTLVNWLAFAPLLLALAAAPITYAALVAVIAQPASTNTTGVVIAAASAFFGLVALGWEVFRTCIQLPSHALPDGPDTKAGQNQKIERTDDPNKPLRAIWRQILTPVWIWVFLAPLAIAPLMAPPPPIQPEWAALLSKPAPETPLLCPAACPGSCTPCTPPASPVATPSLPATPLVLGIWGLAFLLPCAVCWIGFLLAWHHLADKSLYNSGEAPEVIRNDNRDLHANAFQANIWPWLAATVLSSALLTLGAYLAWNLAPLWLVLLGPPWVVGADLLRTTTYVALRSDGLRSDLDREWLARLSAAKLRPVLAIAASAAAVLLLPDLVFFRFTAVWSWLASVIALLTGPVAAAVGNSMRTVVQPSSATGYRPSLQVLSILAALVFAAALAMLAGHADAWILGNLATDAASFGLADYPALTLFAFLFCLLGLALTRWINQRVNLNRFSLHAVYRNRLVRGFLGPVNHHRQPERFTGFDPADNCRLSEIWQPGGPVGLFPVINVALNTTTGQDLARAERKALSFTITPLRCGAAELNKIGAYARTEDYAGDERETGPQDNANGITLGTAMTISGASVSPNMGYNSSPGLAFLMTLFNVRLGAWLPNPGLPKLTPEQARRSGPSHGLGTLLNDLTGHADDTSEFVYLSDGGHFDNLGLYEMLRRRCRRIVAIDAVQDEKYTLSDLGRALEHALIDFGCTVDFVVALQTGNKDLSPQGAYAKIKYPAEASAPAQSGELIYLKPWLPTDMPTELKAFHALKANFPHGSTADQFFTESDFESYRRLGEYLTNTMLEACLGKPTGTLDELFIGAKNLAEPPLWENLM
jgi:Patatin-like phospholipase